MDKPEVRIVSGAQAIIHWITALAHPFCPCESWANLSQQLFQAPYGPAAEGRPCADTAVASGTNQSQMLRICVCTLHTSTWRCQRTAAHRSSALPDTPSCCSEGHRLRTQLRSVADCCGGVSTVSRPCLRMQGKCGPAVCKAGRRRELRALTRDVWHPALSSACLCDPDYCQAVLGAYAYSDLDCKQSVGLIEGEGLSLRVRPWADVHSL